MPEIASSRRWKNRQYKEEVEGRILSFYSFMCSCSLVCTLYAVCMHPQLHTFTAPQPYGHAYSHLCMHCMQSIPELCSRIACIVGFLMHTTFDRPSERQSRRIAYTSTGTCDNRRLRIGRDGGGQSVRRAVKARKSPSSAKTDSEKGHSWFVEECLKTRAVEDKRTDNIRRSRRRILSLFYSLCVRTHLYALCMQSVCILKCIHFRALSSTPEPDCLLVCIVCSQFRSCVLA